MNLEKFSASRLAESAKGPDSAQRGVILSACGVLDLGIYKHKKGSSVRSADIYAPVGMPETKSETASWHNVSQPSGLGKALLRDSNVDIKRQGSPSSLAHPRSIAEESCYSSAAYKRFF